MPTSKTGFQDINIQEKDDNFDEFGTLCYASVNRDRHLPKDKNADNDRESQNPVNPVLSGLRGMASTIKNAFVCSYDEIMFFVRPIYPNFSHFYKMDDDKNGVSYRNGDYEGSDGADENRPHSVEELPVQNCETGVSFDTPAVAKAKEKFGKRRRLLKEVSGFRKDNEKNTVREKGPSLECNVDELRFSDEDEDRKKASTENSENRCYIGNQYRNRSSDVDTDSRCIQRDGGKCRIGCSDIDKRYMQSEEDSCPQIFSVPDSDKISANAQIISGGENKSSENTDISSKYIVENRRLRQEIAFLRKNIFSKYTDKINKSVSRIIKGRKRAKRRFKKSNRKLSKRRPKRKTLKDLKRRREPKNLLKKSEKIFKYNKKNLRKQNDKASIFSIDDFQSSDQNENISETDHFSDYDSGFTSSEFVVSEYSLSSDCEGDENKIKTAYEVKAEVNDKAEAEIKVGKEGNATDEGKAADNSSEGKLEKNDKKLDEVEEKLVEVVGKEKTSGIKENYCKKCDKNSETKNLKEIDKNDAKKVDKGSEKVEVSSKFRKSALPKMKGKNGGFNFGFEKKNDEKKSGSSFGVLETKCATDSVLGKRKNLGELEDAKKRREELKDSTEKNLFNNFKQIESTEKSLNKAPTKTPFPEPEKFKFGIENSSKDKDNALKAFSFGQFNEKTKQDSDAKQETKSAETLTFTLPPKNLSDKDFFKMAPTISSKLNTSNPEENKETGLSFAFGTKDSSSKSFEGETPSKGPKNMIFGEAGKTPSTGFQAGSATKFQGFGDTPKDKTPTSSNTCFSFGAPVIPGAFGSTLPKPTPSNNNPQFGTQSNFESSANIQTQSFSFGSKPNSDFSTPNSSPFTKKSKTTFRQPEKPAFGQSNNAPFGKENESSFGATKNDFGMSKNTPFIEKSKSAFGSTEKTVFGQNTPFNKNEAPFGQKSALPFAKENRPTFGQPQTPFGVPKSTPFNDFGAEKEPKPDFTPPPETDFRRHIKSTFGKHDKPGNKFGSFQSDSGFGSRGFGSNEDLNKTRVFGGSDSVDSFGAKKRTFGNKAETFGGFQQQGALSFQTKSSAENQNKFGANKSDETNFPIGGSGFGSDPRTSFKTSGKTYKSNFSSFEPNNRNFGASSNQPMSQNNFAPRSVQSQPPQNQGRNPQATNSQGSEETHWNGKPLRSNQYVRNGRLMVRGRRKIVRR